MTFPVNGIKLHCGSISAIGEYLQPYLANGDTYWLILKPRREIGKGQAGRALW